MTGSDLISIVLADDAEDIRTILRMKLTRDGRFDVVGEAEDGRALLDLVEILQPQAVIVDLSMPVMDGLEVIPLIKLTSPECKILALSGFSGDEMGSRAITLGADAYLEKGTPLIVIVEKLIQLQAMGRKPAADRPFADDALPPEKFSHFVDFMIHQMNEPVTVIMGYAALIKQSLEEGRFEQLKAAVEVIQKNSETLATLFEALREPHTLERIRTGESPLTA